MYRSFPLNPGEIRSFKMSYHEPKYTVVDKLSDVTYRISDGKGTKVVHYNQLKLIKDADPPADAADEENPRRSERARRPPAALTDYVVEPQGPKIL